MAYASGTKDSGVLNVMMKVLPTALIDQTHEFKLPKVVTVNRHNILCRLNQSVSFFQNLSGHLKLSKTLQAGCFSVMREHHQRIQYKYLGEYLAYALSPLQKLQALNSHYDYIANHLVNSGSLANVQQGITLWSQHYKEEVFSITLEMPELTYREGEWVLAFKANQTTIFMLTFTIMSARIIEKNHSEMAMVIGGVQGVVGCSEWIKLAAKANGDIFPSILLFTALQALALSLGLNTIFAVTAEKQISPAVRDQAERYLNTYDKFWESQGGLFVDGFYKFTPLPAEKPVSELSGTHSSRSKRKRALRKQLLDDMFKQCLAFFKP